MLDEAGIDVRVDHPLDHGAVEAREASPKHEEARSRHARPAGQVEPAQPFAQFPVGQGREVEGAPFAHLAHDHVARFVRAAGRVRVDHVGHFEQALVERVPGLAQALLDAADALAQFARGLDAAGAFGGVPRRADGLAGGVAFGAQALDFPQEGAPPRGQFHDLVQRRLGPARGEVGAHPFEVVADEGGAEHCYSLAAAASARTPSSRTSSATATSVPSGAGRANAPASACASTQRWGPWGMGASNATASVARVK